MNPLSSCLETTIFGSTNRQNVEDAKEVVKQRALPFRSAGKENAKKCFGKKQTWTTSEGDVTPVYEDELIQIESSTNIVPKTHSRFGFFNMYKRNWIQIGDTSIRKKEWYNNKQKVHGIQAYIDEELLPYLQRSNGKEEPKGGSRRPIRGANVPWKCTLKNLCCPDHRLLINDKLELRWPWSQTGITPEQFVVVEVASERYSDDYPFTVLRISDARSWKIRVNMITHTFQTARMSKCNRWDELKFVGVATPEEVQQLSNKGAKLSRQSSKGTGTTSPVRQEPPQPSQAENAERVPAGEPSSGSIELESTPALPTPKSNPIWITWKDVNWEPTRSATLANHTKAFWAIFTFMRWRMPKLLCLTNSITSSS